MKTRKILLRALRRSIPALILIVLCAAVALFADGRYTFSFLQGETILPSFSSPLGEEGDATEPGDTLTPGDKDPSIQVTLPGATSPQNALSRQDIARLSEAVRWDIPGAMTLMSEGFWRSQQSYSKNTTLFALAGGFDFTPAHFSDSVGERETVRYEQPEQFAAPVAVYETEEYDVPAIELYMGYMLLYKGGTTHLYSPDGFRLFAYSSVLAKPAYTRDKDGNPLFLYRPSRNSEYSYVTAGETEFIPSDYDDTLHGRGLYFDYSPSFGLSDNSLMRLVKPITTVTVALDGTETAEESVLWAYGFNPNWRRTTFRFKTALDFSENLAAVTEEDGKLFYIGPYGYVTFYTERQYYYSEWYVQEYLLPPLSAGPESIGFYYYDHGLVRARRQVIDYAAMHYRDVFRVAVDEDFMMDKNGKEFPLPEGYDIVSYSDGVILLTRDGKYGYMDYTGAWIAQPIYDYAQPFYEGLAVVGFGEGDRLMIDTAGNIVIPMGAYDYISNASSGVIAAWRDGHGWDILHKMAKFS